MKTIYDLCEAIKHKNFEWIKSVNFAILECGTNTIACAGTIPVNERWLLPEHLSGIFDINIRGEGYKPLRFQNFNVNMQGRTIINIPLILQEDKLFSDRIVQLDIHRTGYTGPETHIINKDERFEVKQRGEVTFVWRDVKTKEILAKKRDILVDSVLNYFIEFPKNEVEIDLPF